MKKVAENPELTDLAAELVAEGAHALAIHLSACPYAKSELEDALARAEFAAILARWLKKKTRTQKECE
jgi:hypothetical protein